MATSSGFDSLTLASDALKILFGGGIGYTAKLLVGRHHGSVKNIKSAFARLEETGRNAEQVMRSIIGQNPDHALSYTVLTDRHTLKSSIVEAFGSTPSMAAIDVEFGKFAKSLEYADPHFGGTSQATIDEMRSNQLALKTILASEAAKRMSWRVLKDMDIK